MLNLFLTISIIILPLYVMIAITMYWVAARVAKYEDALGEAMRRRADPKLLAHRYEKIRMDIDPNCEDFRSINPNNPPEEIDFLCTEISAAAACYKRNYFIDTVITKITGEKSTTKAGRLYDISHGNPVIAGLIDIIIGMLY